MSSVRLPTGLSASVALITLFAMALWQPRPAAAQQFKLQPRDCYHAKPLPECSTFWVTEAEYYQPIIGTRPKNTEADPYLGYHVAGQLGWMKNRGTSARGIMITGGVSKPGPRWGVLFRERRWYGTTRSLDLSGGFIKAEMRGVETNVKGTAAYGVTGDVTAGWRDIAHVSLRADMVRDENRTASAIYGGAKLGSRSTKGVALAALATLALALLALGGS